MAQIQKNTSVSPRLKKLQIQIIVFLVIVLPVLITTTLSYNRIKKDLNNYTFDRRQTIAQLAAIALSEKLDRLADLGTSLASRVRFRKLVNEDNWDDAIKIMADVPDKFPMVDRIFLSDITGTLMADTPALPGVKGRNFSTRDWYQGVSKNWQTTISEVYKRAAVPQFNVLAIASPVENEKRKIIGILVIQVRVDQLFDWVRMIDVGPSGYVYFVDRKANVAAHPFLLPQGQIMNEANVPIVQKVLQGHHGVEVSYNPRVKEEQVIAYQPVSKFGWGVIAQQPTATAFAPQNSNLRILLFAYIAIVLISCGLAYFIIRTITKQYQIIEEHAAREEAERGIQVRDDFISVAAHELRTPLTALQMQIQLVPKLIHGLSFHGRENILTLLQNSLIQLGRFSKLVDDLLDVTQVKAGKLDLKLTKVNLSEKVGETISHLKSELELAGCKIILDLDASLEGRWDPVRIEQVILNLLTNALKYGRGNPIEISTKAEANMAVLKVRDYGIGIAKEVQLRIFNRYERSVPATKLHGFELGLYITRKIVEAHHGTISVESDLGKGAAFTVRLPIT